MVTSFRTVCDKLSEFLQMPIAQDKADNLYSLLEAKSKEETPQAKNPIFQHELTRIHAIYQYNIVMHQEKLVEGIKEGQLMTPEALNKTNEINFIYRDRPDAAQLRRQMAVYTDRVRDFLKHNETFENRIVIIIEQSNPGPQIDVGKINVARVEANNVQKPFAFVLLEQQKQARNVGDTAKV